MEGELQLTQNALEEKKISHGLLIDGVVSGSEKAIVVGDSAREASSGEVEEPVTVILHKRNTKQGPVGISTNDILENPEIKEAIRQEIEEIWATALQKCGMDEKEPSKISHMTAAANGEESRQNQVARKVDTLVFSGSEFLDKPCPQFRPANQNYDDKEISVRASGLTNLKAKPTNFGIGLDVLKLMEAVEECTQTLSGNECLAEAPSCFSFDIEPDVILEGEILEMSPDDFCLTTRTIPIEDEYECSEVELCDLIGEGDIMEIADPQENYTSSLLTKMSDTSFYNSFESYANDLMASNQDVLPDNDSGWIGNYQHSKSADSIDYEVDINALEESHPFEKGDMCVMDNSDFYEYSELRRSFSEEDGNTNANDGNETESDVPAANHQCEVKNSSAEVGIEALEASYASHDSALNSVYNDTCEAKEKEGCNCSCCNIQ